MHYYLIRLTLALQLSSIQVFFPNSVFCKILFHSSKSHFPGQTKYPGCITNQALVGWHFCPWGDLLGYSLVSMLCGD